MQPKMRAFFAPVMAVKSSGLPNNVLQPNQAKAAASIACGSSPSACEDKTSTPLQSSSQPLHDLPVAHAAAAHHKALRGGGMALQVQSSGLHRQLRKRSLHICGLEGCRLGAGEGLQLLL